MRRNPRKSKVKLGSSSSKNEVGDDDEFIKKCVICDLDCCGDGDDGGNGDSFQFELAFRLLCKLLNVAGAGVGGRKGEVSNLFKFLEEFSSVSRSAPVGVGRSFRNEDVFGGASACGRDAASTCEACTGALREILRLEGIIEDLRISQMVHVNSLKKSLMTSSSFSSETRSDKGKPGGHGGDKSNFWKVLRRQLIGCLKDNAATTSNVSRRTRPGGTSTTSRSSQLGPERLQSCSVRLTRLSSRQLRASSSTPSSVMNTSASPAMSTPSTSSRLQNYSGAASVGVGRRQVRQSKMRAYDFLKKSLSKNGQHQEEESEEEDGGHSLCTKQKFHGGDDEKMEEFGGEWDDNDIENEMLHDDEYFDDNDDPGDVDFCPSPGDVKPEVEHEDEEEEEDVESSVESSEETMDCEWSMKTKTFARKDPLMCPEIKAGSETTIFNNMMDRCTRVHLISPDLYIFGCSVIRFIPGERLFICQEPGCSAIIPGTFLDSSILENIRTHVRQSHNSINLLDHKTRSCPICSKKCSGTPKQFRGHIREFHVVGKEKKKGAPIIICEACGRPSVKPLDIMHKWSHRNFEEKVAAIQAGEIFPNQLKKDLKKKKNRKSGDDRLREFLFGTPEKDFPIPNTPILMRKKVTVNPVKRKIAPVKQNQNSKKRRSEIPQPKRTSIFSLVYCLDENAYLYQYTTFMYFPIERVFKCQEEGCSEMISESEIGAVQKIRCHVEENHLWSKGDVDHVLRTCSLCHSTIMGLTRFRDHMFRRHPEPTTQKGVILCETCMKPVATKCSLEHFWKHKSDQDALDAIHSGEAIATGWKKRLQERRTEPLYSLVFHPETVIQENTGAGETVRHGVLGLRRFHSKRVEGQVPALQIKRRSARKTKHIPRTEEFEISAFKRQRTSVFDIVYCLQDNFYFYKYTMFKYSEDERTFHCQEAGCSEVIPDWEDGSDGHLNFVSRIKNHVDEEHNSDILLEENEEKTCPFLDCAIETNDKLRLPNFRTHIVKYHKDPSKNVIHALCEFCLKPASMRNYLEHIWTHKSDEDALAAIQSGEAVATEWRKRLQLRKTQPLFSLVFPHEKVEQELSGFGEIVPKFARGRPRIRNAKQREKRPGKILTISGAGESIVFQKQRTSVYDIVYGLQDNFYLYKYTIFKYSEDERQFHCQEPGCLKVIGYWENGSDGNAVSIIRKHVDENHKPDSLFTEKNAKPCPFLDCAFETNSLPQLRTHIVKFHKDPSKPLVGALCEFCLRPATMRKYLEHIWTHKSDEDALVSITRREAVSTEWKKSLLLRKTEPLYSIILSQSEKLKSLGYCANEGEKHEGEDDQQNQNEDKKFDIETPKNSQRKYRGPPACCEICGKVFATKLSLKNHLVCHDAYEDRQKFKCTYCEKELLSKRAVQDHVAKVHRPELRRFRFCEEPGCGKRFNYRDFTKFYVHMRQHRGEKPCVCEQCGARFHGNASLRSHQKKVHGPRKYICDECGEAYKWPQHLYRHQKNRHGMKR